MTPVAIPVAVSATSWDAALAETLSGAAERAFGVAARGTVHAVHTRVVNVIVDGTLIAIADDTLDDAPATIRVPVSGGWAARGVLQGSPVGVSSDRLELHCPDGPLAISLSGAASWTAPRVDLGALTTDDLARSLAVLDTLPAPAPVTPFGHAAGLLLRPRVATLRDAVLAGSDEEVRTAASGLIGLGEGLTPSGDDILTGLALLASQRGMLLGRTLPALATAIHDGADRTGLLSATTMAHAAAGRGRQSLHDLTAALRDRDDDALLRTAGTILEIGHTSGADILTGIRLALDLERAARSAAPTSPHTTEKEEHP